MIECVHPNRIRSPPENEDFQLVAINDGLGRFDTVPFLSVLERWENDKMPASISGTPAYRVRIEKAGLFACYKPACGDEFATLFL